MNSKNHFERLCKLVQNNIYHFFKVWNDLSVTYYPNNDEQSSIAMSAIGTDEFEKDVTSLEGKYSIKKYKIVVEVSANHEKHAVNIVKKMVTNCEENERVTVI